MTAGCVGRAGVGEAAGGGRPRGPGVFHFSKTSVIVSPEVEINKTGQLKCTMAAVIKTKCILRISEVKMSGTEHLKGNTTSVIEIKYILQISEAKINATGHLKGVISFIIYVNTYSTDS